ncbi:adenylate/guanylate cyclase domain-containing protein [Rhizobium mongolense]|uniref:Class 3 adenylate cyclase n=1 Tax=Rhizobium mongolense TaxID=57676 RepID=A0ABR6IUY5_9HYPH|nr:adenylate/guanylate cyclase domain-containing protein [Rhizobium mongolense]MBB4231713.1 class 3 adenylate cyclase [Rhizobium mongolense]
MAEERVQRRLAAIVVADVVGYSRLMEEDEVATLAVLKERRTKILQPIVRAHGGRIVKVMGDGVLLEFPSAVNAMSGAIELQRKMEDSNAALSEARRILLRIGINLGDVVVDGSDLYGDGSTSPHGYKVWPSRVISTCRRASVIKSNASLHLTSTILDRNL